MKVQQVHIKDGFSEAPLAAMAAVKPNVVIAFGDVRFFEDGTLGQKLRRVFPGAIVIGCSTAGEIFDHAVYDGTLVVTALGDTDSEFFLAMAEIKSARDSKSAGAEIGRQLRPHRLKAAMILSPGLNVNGSDLVDGLASSLDENIVITGGLAGDGGRFQKTYTLFNETVSDNHVVALGSRGALDISCGSQGGWQPFGPGRTVTKSVDNILYELDGKSALQLYKEYLGDKAKDLPASGLLYPIAVLKDDQTTGLIRTILNIDEKEGSLILAGNIKVGSTVRLMHAQTSALVEGARQSCQAASPVGVKDAPSLDILISCVGRKLVMGDDVDDEIGVARSILGSQATIAGFYSYGEICPFSSGGQRPHLHNQTMTITRFGRSG